MVESSVTFMNLYDKCPVVTRQPLGDGTYCCFSSGSMLGTLLYLHFPKDQVCNGVSVSCATPFFIVI